MPSESSSSPRRHLLGAVTACAAAAALGLHGIDAPAGTPVQPGASGVTVLQPWVRSTRPGQHNAAGYLEIRSATPDRLVGVKPSPDVAERGELHTMRMDGDLMVMREVEAFPVGPAGALKLQPGGNHLMLIALKKPLAAGDKVDAVLVFEKAGEVAVRMQVLDAPVNGSSPAHGPAGGRKH
jgi:periplasmic copper chaperone A